MSQLDDVLTSVSPYRDVLFARKELADLRDDRKRLDWLLYDASCCNHIRIDGERRPLITRAAIDAAMENTDDS